MSSSCAKGQSLRKEDINLSGVPAVPAGLQWCHSWSLIAREKKELLCLCKSLIVTCLLLTLRREQVSHSQGDAEAKKLLIFISPQLEHHCGWVGHNG